MEWKEFVEDIMNVLKLEPEIANDTEEEALADLLERQSGEDAFVDEDYLPHQSIGLKDSTVKWLIKNEIPVPKTWNQRIEKQTKKVEEKEMEKKAVKPVAKSNVKPAPVKPAKPVAAKPAPEKDVEKEDVEEAKPAPKIMSKTAPAPVKPAPAKPAPVTKKEEAKETKPASKPAEKEEKKAFGRPGKNELGHITGCISDKIDKLFLKGVTVEELEKQGIDAGRAKGHFKHLQNDKADLVTVKFENGKYTATLK